MAVAILSGCSGQSDNELTATEADFVGKWQSSRLQNPIYLYENNEWEIKRDNGEIYQYGLWRYENKMIKWTYKRGEHFTVDDNQVIAVTQQNFKLLESDKTVTRFHRLD